MGEFAEISEDNNIEKNHCYNMGGKHRKTQYIPSAELTNIVSSSRNSSQNFYIIKSTDDLIEKGQMIWVKELKKKTIQHKKFNNIINTLLPKVIEVLLLSIDILPMMTIMPIMAPEIPVKFK